MTKGIATKSVLTLFIFIITLIPSFTFSTYAHNSNAIAVPVAKHPIILDGVLNDTEWNDAFKFNFTSPRLHEGYVIIYLKYELFDKALSGAFYIPDKTPFFNKTSPDQISFNFDTLHSASKTVGPDDQYIIFVRDAHAEYYRSLFISIANSTNSEHTLKLSNPFSKLDFQIVDNSKSWQGEFKIYFSEDPEIYGFAVQQADSYKNSTTGKINHFFINYPIAKLTQADIPSTWGDINFFGINHYAKNIKKLCSKNSSISPNNVAILCIKSVTPSSIEEKVSEDIIAQGILGNLINGTGVKNQMISTYIVDSNGKAVSPATNEPTNDDGSFLSTIRNLKLSADNNTYSIFVKPTSNFYSGLNITSGLDIRKHMLTVEEILPILSTYFGLIAAGIGVLAFVPRIKKYVDENKGRGILYKCMDEINTIYYSSSENSEKRLKNLKDKRNSVLNMFHRGEISEEHFKLLDNKISEYEQKIGKR